MKILIAIPTFETITPETFQSIWDLDTDHELYFKFIKGYDCAIARNMIVKYFLEDDVYDYLLMVDSDIIIPGGTLNCMLDSPVDLCLGVYPRKNTTDGCSTIIKPGTAGYHQSYYYDDLPLGKIPAKGGGMGCALISRRVLTALSYPYFKYISYDNGEYLSEDYYFCGKVREAGFSIEADTRVRCGHLVRKFQYD